MSAPEPAPLPQRPGTFLLRRDRTTCQWGLDPSVAVRVPATAAAEPAGAMPVEVSPGLITPDTAAVLQRDPQLAQRRLHARAAARVEVRGSLGVDARSLLASAGVTLHEPGRTAGRSPDVVLLLSEGEAERDPVDRLVRAGTPHLVVRLVDGIVTVGPFVVPGRTACLRCVDEHLAGEDPAHHALVAQHARLSRRPHHDVRPRDHALLTLATAWAVRDVVTHVEGDRPTTWSATVRLEAGLASVTEVHWLRHPECGCLWLPDQDASATLDP